VLEGELTVKLAGQTSVLREGKTAISQPGLWHDRWNASGHQDARVRVEVTPGDRFAHMIETVFGLGRLGHTNRKGMPHPLQLALFALEFSDVIEFRSPPPAVRRTLFRALPPLRDGAVIARHTRSSLARFWPNGPSRREFEIGNQLHASRSSLTVGTPHHKLTALAGAGRGFSKIAHYVANRATFRRPWHIDGCRTRQSQTGGDPRSRRLLAADGADEAGTLAALKRHRETVFDPAVAFHNGRVVKLIGDGTIVEFASVVDAVNCAMSVQRSGAPLRPTSPSCRSC
jgi:hypothetical protein